MFSLKAITGCLKSLASKVCTSQGPSLLRKGHVGGNVRVFREGTCSPYGKECTGRDLLLDACPTLAFRYKPPALEQHSHLLEYVLPELARVQRDVQACIQDWMQGVCIASVYLMYELSAADTRPQT